MEILKHIRRKFNHHIICCGNCKKIIKKNAKFVIKDEFIFNHYPYSKNQKADYGNLYIGKNAQLSAGGRATFRYGCKLYIGDNAILEIGTNLFVNSNTSIYVREKIVIGNNCVISSNCVIRDSDTHTVIGSINHAPIMIGNHVWIGSNTIILKGVKIGDGSVVGAGSVVTHDVPPKTLVAGNPAKVIRENIDWKI